MNIFYTLGIHLYAFSVELSSLFHRKARMMRFGQWKTNGILREHIDRSKEYIWFHAASLGEFEQGRPMIEKIKAQYPHYKILLTFFSPSGYEVRKNYANADVVCYLPFDTPYKVKKFINLANPAIAIFIKYEFWGNYLGELKKRHIPTYCISGIFRQGQWFFKWYGRFYLGALRCFDHLFVQDAHSADLLARHGITNTTVAGDTRFDRVVDVQKQAPHIGIVESFVESNRQNGQLFLIAGSSWPRDEEIVINYFNGHPEIKLIIAPHEIERNRLLYIHSLLKRPSICLSEASEQTIAQKDCLIIDSFGLLSSIYRYGDMAYLGGGFGKGIHNILEAAVYGMPVIFGPNCQKYKEAKDLIACGGGFSVSGEESFNSCMDNFVSYHNLLTSSGEAAGLFVRQSVGATAKILAALQLDSYQGKKK
ncbi:3-deoxy-D-manno-octulosonic acid transferase [Bacteroidia bacterium]|nr:3-deoxy-D-manno-octulosonic acid transferase [Bacteroidia bacterium]